MELKRKLEEFIQQGKQRRMQSGKGRIAAVGIREMAES